MMDNHTQKENIVEINELTIHDIEEKIEIRNEPHIYAFSTNTIPNYIKVGDTFRPIEQRLDEWREKYNGLKRLFPSITNEDEGLAVVNKDIYFRDYSLHKYFEKIHNDCRIKQDNEIFLRDNSIYFSKEFFKGIDVDTIKDGIKDIKADYNNEIREYDFYKLIDKKPDATHWKNDQKWNLRENQEVVVNNFLDKVDKQKELLMYAVMRFGKSFTSLMCAKLKGYKKVLVVSAKADVVGEWKQTVEKPEHFKEYAFLSDKDFVRYYERNKDIDLIDEILNQNVTDDEYLKDKNKVVVFLTLQNLSGKAEDGKNIKKKLEKIYNTKFDLVIVDETHYGAWAKSYGSPLNNKEEDEDTVKKELKEYDKFINTTNAKVQTEHKLHLSGTPYNLLYNEKFDDKNIIATCQFSDILRDKEKWIEENNKKPEAEQKEEWENPYFGFPKMLRFAFNIPEATRQKLIALKENGKWSLNDLLETNRDDNNTKFIHEEDVLQLLKAIDGSAQEKGILGFLNIPKIKDNNVCKHIVIVLPYKYSCDAMEILLQNNKDKFANLVNDNVEILNITGHKVKPSLVDIDNVKKTITECENQGKKTITLTVHKMLTGVTVPEWDTMIMLKNSKSPQEYDQAIFRIQNQYVKEYVEEKNGKTIKKDMKPQTILVDFDPMRMFELLGLSTRIVNKIKNDELSLEEALEVETKCFNIIAYNADKLIEVQPNNLIEIITNYNNNKSLMESVSTIKLNTKLLENKYIEEFIKNQSKADISNKLTADAHKGEERDIDLPPDEESDEEDKDENSQQDNTNLTENDKSKKVNNELQKQYRMCILGLAFYSFLTNSNICGLKDILRSIDEESEEKERNERIFENLKLDKNFIEEHIKSDTRANSFEIDEFIKKANMLSKDKKLSAEERAKNALNNFSKISESEIVTPNEICENMLDCIGEDKLIETINNSGKILDIASKTGEFAYAVYSKLKDKVNAEKLKNSIYAIPTSSTTYEFTRKVFENLNLPIENIVDPMNFNSYDLIYKVKDENGDIDFDRINKILAQRKPFNTIKLTDKIQEGGKKVKFDVIVGNPPYQEESKQNSSINGQNPRTNIFHHFQILASCMAEENTCLIYPGIRWLHQSGKGRGFKEFSHQLINDKKLEKVVFYPEAKEVFNNSGIPDGITIVLTNKNKQVNGFKYEYIDKKNKSMQFCNNPGDDLFIINPADIEIAKKIKNFVSKYNLNWLHESILPRSLFEIDSEFVEKNKNIIKIYNDNSEIDYNHEIKLLTNDKAGPAGRSRWYIIDKKYINKNVKYINEWQVVVSSAHAGGQEGRDNQISIIDNHSAFGRARLALKSFTTQKEAENFKKFAQSLIIRYAFLLSDESLSSLAKYVPDLLDYTKQNNLVDFTKPIDEQLCDLIELDEVEIKYINKIIKSME